MRLRARNFNRVTVAEDKDLIKYHAVEIENSKPNCFSINLPVAQNDHFTDTKRPPFCRQPTLLGYSLYYLHQNRTDSD